jgi:hypothetical protein
VRNFGSVGHNPLADSDHDGLSDQDEYRLGTDPNNPDTDGDGVPDGRDGWPNDDLVNVPPLPEYSYAVIDLGPGVARIINSQNQIVGTFPNSTVSGFFWDRGTRQNALNAAPIDLNDFGVILYSHDTTLHPPGADDHLLGFDPNITWSHLSSYFATALSNSGRVTMVYATFGSGPGGAVFTAGMVPFGGGAISFLRKPPDSNDRVLTLADKYYHGFRNTWETMASEPCPTPDNPSATCPIFGTLYDNTTGLDDAVYPVTINNDDQVLGDCTNFEGLDIFGYPVLHSPEPPSSISIVIWSGQHAEVVAQEGPEAWATDLSDDGVVAGFNGDSLQVLWLKSDNGWQQDILPGLYGCRNLTHP